MRSLNLRSFGVIAAPVGVGGLFSSKALVWEDWSLAVGCTTITGLGHGGAAGGSHPPPLPALPTEARGLMEGAPSKGRPLTCGHRRGRGSLGWQKQHRPLVHPRLLPECLSRMLFLPLSLKRENSPTPSHHFCRAFISQALILLMSMVSVCCLYP